MGNHSDGTGERTCKRYHNFIGASKPMLTVYQIIDNVATSKAPILITGETGTGKELCAEAIYKVLLNGSKVITAEMIITRMDEEVHHKIATSHFITDSTKEITPVVTINRFCPFKEIEKEVILKAIEFCDGSVVKAAKLLEISKSYIYKLKKQWKKEDEEKAG
jgi:DNA-binding NtrC family response regulator